MKVIQKLFLPILVTLGMYACDESGGFEYEHLGKWQKDGDSVVYSDSRNFYPIDEDIDGRNTLEFFEDLSYETITIDRLGDTTYQYVGKWSLSLQALTINYEVGYPDVFDLVVDENSLRLAYSGWSYKYIQVYHKVE